MTKPDIYMSYATFIPARSSDTLPDIILVKVSEHILMASSSWLVSNDVCCWGNPAVTDDSSYTYISSQITMFTHCGCTTQHTFFIRPIICLALIVVFVASLQRLCGSLIVVKCSLRCFKYFSPRVASPIVFAASIINYCVTMVTVFIA